MTIKELSQLYWLNKEIEHDKERLEKLELEAASVRSPKLTDMPHGGSIPHSFQESLVCEIVDLQAIIAAKQIQCIHEKQRLERYISGIDDRLTRQIFVLRFSEGMTWDQVADEIGGGNTTWMVKKRCYRYLDSTKDSEAAEAAV